MKIELDEMLQGCKAFRGLERAYSREAWQCAFWHQEHWDYTGYLASPTAALRRMAELTGDEKLLAMLTSH